MLDGQIAPEFAAPASRRQSLAYRQEPDHTRTVPVSISRPNPAELRQRPDPAEIWRMPLQLGFSFGLVMAKRLCALR